MTTLSTLDFYQIGKSLIHELDPKVKIVSAIAIILSNALLSDGQWGLFGLTWVILIAIALVAKLNIIFLLKRGLIALPFALVSITVMFTIPGDLLYEISLFNWNLSITLQGMVRFLSIMIRAWLSIQATILLTATTSFPDLAHGLRHLRVPIILITILSFMYRYLFVLSSEAGRLLQARAARSASLPGSIKPSVTWNAKNAGNMVGQLFLRSYERSDRVYNAMVARGFQGDFLTYNPHRMKIKDWGLLLVFLATLIILQLIQLTT